MSNYERARLHALRQLNLLDTPPSEAFDRITRMASQLFNLPIAAVSLTDNDRQWFKSRVGVEHWEIPRFKACCAEVSDTSEVLVLPDLLASPTYHDSLLAQSGIRFYAGAPLITRDGYTLGSMCVLGTEPREISALEMNTLKDLAAMVMSQIELQHAVGRVDSTTGLANYSQFLDDIEDMARDREGTDLFAFNIELIDFQQAGSLQRVMGPSYLDELSRGAGYSLQQTLGQEAKLYHVGPSQFAFVKPAESEDKALMEALSMRARLLELTLDDASPFMLRPVVGVAPFRLGEQNPSDILRTAHSASRDARQDERGAGLYSSIQDANHKRRFNLIAQFRAALDAEDQLYMVYQPRVALASGECVGAEALIRWRHPTFGDISPAEFIPLVENTHMAHQLTDWVMARVIKQAAIWHHQGRNLTISLNVAAANLEEPDFTERLLGYLRGENLPLGSIELELTESGLISNGLAATLQLNTLVEAGINVAIDDFGTGYSSLAYLNKIPAQVVKIDRSFIESLAHETRSQTLVKSMISMAHDLDYRVVAEGVETLEALEFLHTLGCDEVQGYYFSKPLAISDFEIWQQARRN
jgi:EAL domain-containing protein (putative c-di-GMP-specific phosphodiesterase class I)